MQATSVFVCIHACVHSGNCARGTTRCRRELESLPTSILSLPAMGPMEIEFPSLLPRTEISAFSEIPPSAFATSLP